MLEFFRKYQRYFFIAITVVVIASFSLFGTYSTFSKNEKREDTVVAHAVDGSPMMLSEVRALSRFIGTDREDRPGHGLLPNLCNDGVIRHDLLTPGVADLLAAAYFEAMKPGLDARLDRAKRYRHYAHPRVKNLSAEAVWNQFLPEMGHALESLKEEKEAGVHTFSHLARLYRQQQYLTPETLKKILYYQHQQLGLQIDPALLHADLSLFGYQSLSDWFGSEFLTLSAEFILNGAALAEKKGFEVTLEEAKGDLLVNFQSSLQRIHPPGKAQPEISFSEHLRSLGFEEKGAAEVWRKVLLMRKYFQGVAQTTFIDRLSFKDYASYARETATLRLYRWPEPLRLKNMEDLIQFQFYIAAVALPLSDPLGLPDQIKAKEVVEEDYPELVQATYKAKVKDASLSQVALRTQVLEVWEWELEEKNWDALKGVFPFLPVGSSREERFESLEKLSAEKRSQVDSYARLRILEQHPEWSDAALDAMATVERTVSISKASSSPRVEKPWRLYGLLQQAASGDGAAKEALLRYSDDGKTVHRFEEVEELLSPHILTFADAKSQGLLSEMADRSLTAAYSKMRGKHPARFQSENGSWKPFSEVKSEVAKLYFADVFRAIEGQEMREWTDELRAEMRLYSATRTAYQELQSDPAQGSNLATRTATRTMDDQFKLEESEISVQRTRQEEWMKEKAFLMMPNVWSPIRVPPGGELSFFYLIDKKPCETPILEQITFGKQSIAADAQRYMAEKLLETISKSHSILLPKESVQ
jgi:hypothetical protein